MEHQVNFTFWDYFVFIGLLISSSLIGVYYAVVDRKSKNNENYLTGSRNLALFPVCMSLIASFLSSNTMLGVPSEVYLVGTQFAAHLIGFSIACLLAAHVFMPIYYRLQLTSVNKYLHKRFNSVLVRLAGSVGFILCTLPYLGVVLYGPSLALAAVTPLSVKNSILIVGVICTFYTSIGGIKAVIWTDVVQCLLMVAGLAVVIYQGIIENGGIANAWKIADEGGRIVYFNGEFNIYRADTFWLVVFGSLVGWGGTYCVKQTQVQRYCCMESKSKARQTLYWNIPGVAIICIMAVLVGVLVYAKYAGCDPIQLKLIEKPDQLVPFFIMDTMSKVPGLPGLFVASVFSGSLSTLSSGVNALTTVTWDDLLKRHFKTTSKKKILYINKFTALLYGVMTIVIAFIVGRLGTVLQASLSLSGSVTGPLFALFCLGIFFPFVNWKAAFIGVVSGFSLCFFITIGALINPRPKLQLPVTINNCSADIIETIGNFAYQTALEDIKTKHFSPIFHPEGLNRLFHVSYMSLALIGFVVSMVVGLTVSLFLNLIGDKQGPIEPHLLSPLVLKLYPSCISKSSVEKDNQKCDKISLPENFAFNTKVPQTNVNVVRTDSVQRMQYKRKSLTELTPTKQIYEYMTSL